MGTGHHEPRRQGQGQSTANGASVAMFAWEGTEELKTALRPVLVSCEFPRECP